MSRAGHIANIREALALFRRPQPLTLPMIVLFSLVPFYLVIGEVVSKWPTYSPELALDRAIPVLPVWSVIYGSLFLAALLPVFVLHQQKLIRRTVLAYVSVWLAAFAIFLLYPTHAPSRLTEFEPGFFGWCLRLIYESDIDYNCFPSLHVAQCALAAFACSRVHRGVGWIAGIWAVLVGLSTLFTKQHYVADVVAGGVMAWMAYRVFLHPIPRDVIPESERRLAPVLALGAAAVYVVMVAALWLLYLLGDLK